MLQVIAYAVAGVCLLVVSATMLARANDLRWRKGLVWNARLIGFVFAGVAPWGLILFDWLSGHIPSLFEVLFFVGLMLVFVTTPYLPPWWKWISGWHGADEVKHTDDRRESNIGHDPERRAQ